MCVAKDAENVRLTDNIRGVSCRRRQLYGSSAQGAVEKFGRISTRLR